MSPKINNISKSQDTHPTASPALSTKDFKPPSPSRTDAAPPKASDEGQTADSKPNTNAQPFAPPPRPTQQNPPETPGEYFGGAHTSHFLSEPNPFEHSFGKGSADTPSQNILPSVHTLASPAPLLPTGTPGWGGNSLRSGPLSPAMLTGPTGAADYFTEHHFSRGLITPNESSLRTGLTPGGGGSMFPAPSPNSQALFNSLQNGGATPGTLDFHRTAMHAAAQSKQEYSHRGTLLPAQAPEQGSKVGMDQKQFQSLAPPHDVQHDIFGNNPDAKDGANGLLMLSHGTPAHLRNNQFAVPQPPGAMNTMHTPMPTAQMGEQIQNTSPTRAPQGSISSIAGMSEGDGFSEDAVSDQKPQTRTRGKKASNGKTAQATNGRRKAEDTPSKPPTNKKAKGSIGSVNLRGASMDASMLDMDDMGDDSDEENMKMEHEEGGRKMTDEEKRKNFLERNRVAALKCRQRKKQWLANLQTKVEIFSSENDALNAQVSSLREDIVNLKTLLLAHKDCPVSQAQGLGGLAMNNFAQSIGHHGNPYGMGMVNGGQPMQMQGMGQR